MRNLILLLVVTCTFAAAPAHAQWSGYNQGGGYGGYNPSAYYSNGYRSGFGNSGFGNGGFGNGGGGYGYGYGNRSYQNRGMGQMMGSSFGNYHHHHRYW